MRYITALVLAMSLGAAASLYTPGAQAAGVYVGIGLPVPVVSIAPHFYAGLPWYGPGYYGPHYWGYGHAFYGYGRGFGYYHGFAGFRRR
jgi:hypothetical protein